MVDAVGQTGPSPARIGSGSAAPDDRRGFSRVLGLATVVVAIVCAAVTFAILTGSTDIVPTRTVVLRLIGVNAAVLTALLGIIGYEVVKILRARRQRKAGARLHLRLLGLFSLIAAVPAVLVAIVATLTLDRGLDRWFSERTQSMVEFSQVVARAYLDEYRQVLNVELTSAASELNRSKALFDFDRDRFEAFMSDLAAIRTIPYMSLVGPDGQEVLRAETRFSEGYRQPDPSFISLATDIEPVLIPPGQTNQLAGIIRLSEFTDHYLFIARAVDPRVVQYLLVTEQNAAEFQEMQDRRFGVQLSFGFMFLGLALIMLLSAMWIAIAFADRLVLPVRRLMVAAQQISSGNLYVQVPIRRAEGDLAVLGQTFNRMTNDLRSQRNELVDANEQLDSRRRFTEAVLEGVSAGVIGVDRAMAISLVNRSAAELLGTDASSLLGRTLSAAVPELAPLLPAKLDGQAPWRSPREVRIERGDQLRILTVSLTVEHTDEGAATGAVVTFDDVSDLVAAQRSSAWADIARRIAHEIKNPLTPIQLSAERLKRRYGRKLTEDTEVFDQCTDTIIRQVGDIGRMVDEFSSFARMPKPEFASGDLAKVIKDTAFLMANGYQEIEITTDVPEAGLPMSLDERLMGQVLTNLIKNAAEGIAAAPGGEDAADAGDAAASSQHRIAVAAYTEGNKVIVDIADSGIGFPKTGRAKLLEPYMTTREKGTGLGLAIVRRVVEDHGGTMRLLDGPDAKVPLSGALVRLTFGVEPDEEEGRESSEG
ncbi:MAG: PAS domain-containing sensor histidine kinase [Devosiaceae bacterium]|nr:PAS domain-containing sensor histidine kinase [Devosiaceae bacterium MH13]